MVSESEKQKAAEILRDTADMLSSLPFKYETGVLIEQIFQVQRMLADMSEK